ncbi:unnamed protein product [Tetraodon nigroviridis]|uniref:(spotted green pufferfish) hypothetical protein n=1 Tax=Tetraodon nigroviridis TaxID=99883 RepID=Q4SY19_TETNG|nr:unnamed protein product [Tetraodon nigroviridis]
MWTKSWRETRSYRSWTTEQTPCRPEHRSFESSAAKLKNKYWWKNCKMMIMMGVISVICVGVIFLYFFY